jgi:hypothetical protein
MGDAPHEIGDRFGEARCERQIRVRIGLLLARPVAAMTPRTATILLLMVVRPS